VPTQGSLHHKYGDYKKNIAYHYPKLPLPKSPVKIRLTSDLPFWLDAQKRNVVDIYPEVWEDFQGLTEQLCSFSSMRKFQQAQNLRSLTIRTGVADRDVEMLWRFIETLYELFPHLERLLVKAWSPQNQDIYYLRQLFVTRTPDPEHRDMFYKNKLPNIDPHKTQSLVIHEYGTGSIYDPLPLGFRCKLNPKTGEKRDFIFKMDRPWSKGDKLEF
jgi:hypothetical protein